MTTTEGIVGGLVLVSVMALAACDAFVFLSGRVVGPDGKPMSTARIQVVPDHNPQQLDEHGSFEANTSGGSIEVVVTADGYRPVKKTVRGGMVHYACTFILAPTSGPGESQADCREMKSRDQGSQR